MLEDSFLEQIKHAPDREGRIEESSCYAYRVDGSNGLSEHLGFVNGTLSNVDYVCKSGHEIQLIELSDLINSINECQEHIDAMIAEKRSRNNGRIPSREEKTIMKKAWFPITAELYKKWFGSMLVIERLYRKNKIYSDDPACRLLIVFKNHTDIRMMDALQDRLKGLIRNLQVCTTSQIPEKLLLDVTSET